jgi:hypothetical protein
MRSGNALYSADQGDTGAHHGLICAQPTGDRRGVVGCAERRIRSRRRYARGHIL